MINTNLNLLNVGLGINRNNVMGWTPAQITTALWLDASDASTITENVTVLGNVAQWDDLSGNNNHATQTLEAKQPTISNNVLTFDGTDDCLRITDSSSLEITEGLNISAVIKAVADTGYILTRNGNSSTNVQYGLLFFADTVDSYLDGNSRDSNIAVKNTDHIISMNWDKVVAEMFVNGSSNGSGAYSTSLTNQINTQIGCRSEATDGSTQNIHFEGEIAEIILTPNSLSTEDRQKIEGYLAWKHGLQANLPIGHPYKNSAP